MEVAVDPLRRREEVKHLPQGEVKVHLPEVEQPPQVLVALGAGRVASGVPGSERAVAALRRGRQHGAGNQTNIEHPMQRCGFEPSPHKASCSEPMTGTHVSNDLLNKLRASTTLNVTPSVFRSAANYKTVTAFNVLINMLGLKTITP